MDYNNPPPSWVEHVVIEMRASQAYRTQVMDEWYETLPVPAWNAQATWLIVGFGKNTRTAGPMSPVQSRPPHLTCAVSFPDGQQHWTVDNTAQRSWPTDVAAPTPTLPALAGSLMDRRRRYYSALSEALKQGAFASHLPANPPAACAAARETRDAFLPASTYPNLAPIYAGALANVDGWLKTNCGAR